MDALFAALQPLLQAFGDDVGVIIGVFARVSGLVFLVPGVGERTVSVRVRLAIAIAIAFVVYPAVRPLALASAPEVAQEVAKGAAALSVLARITFSEAVVGLALGLSTRLMIFALQIAGAIIAQNASISQIFGQSIAGDTETPITALLTFAGIAIALSLGVHIEAVKMFIASYEPFPFGELALLKGYGQWLAERGGAAFALAFSLAAPFVVLGVAYNLIIGAANRAMPQLMVAFVGAPAITGAGLLLLAISAAIILERWYAASGPMFRLVGPGG